MDRQILKALQDIASELKKIRKIMERQEVKPAKYCEIGFNPDQDNAEED